MHKNTQKSDGIYDLICVGGGIMSSTLAIMVKMLDPSRNIAIFERLDEVGLESSEAWNNAGTGHSGFCELNYTPEKSDGSIDITKAVNTLSQFERSKEFWSYLIKNGLIDDPEKFIKSCPHHSWVTGQDDVDFLKKRYETMQKTPMFRNMKFSEDKEVLKEWFPLIMRNREEGEIMAGTRMELGTEVNYGALTRLYFNILDYKFNTSVELNSEVIDISRKDDYWIVDVKNEKTNWRRKLKTKHVFIGAGGKALPLLQKTGIPEKNGYGGFPVSGEWLICKNREIVNQHWAKVYSKEGPDAPPMSTPHLDTRYIDGRRELLFGPFAGFSSKFLKNGSYTDLFTSIKLGNIKSLLGVFWHNLDLSKYLISQVMMSSRDRIEVLREFVKDARAEDWELRVAGQRVQIIKPDKEEWGKLQFGTEVVHSKDGSITALLGASPGASTAVHIILEVLKYVFPKEMNSGDWSEKLDEMIPFWNREVDVDAAEFKATQKFCSEMLKLEVAH